MKINFVWSFWILFVAILVFLGGHDLVISHQLSKKGFITLGVISNKTYLIARNNWRCEYQFQIEKTIYKGAHVFMSRHYNIGDTIKVVYFSKYPRINRAILGERK